MDNTRRFDLYVSGILYARLQLGGQGPLLQKLDVYSGAFSPWGPLTPEDRDFYKSLSSWTLAASPRPCPPTKLRCAAGARCGPTASAIPATTA